MEILRVWFPRQAHLPWSKIEKAELPKTTQKKIAEPCLPLTQILHQLVDFWGKSKGISIHRKLQLEYICLSLWAVNHQCNQNHRGNHSNPHIGNATARLHAPIMLPFDVWLFFGKKTEVLLFDWAWQTAGFFLVHRISGAIDVGLKCTDRSWWSLATVTSGHSHGWTQPWSHRNCGISPITSLPLSDVLSLIGYLDWSVFDQAERSLVFVALFVLI